MAPRGNGQNTGPGAPLAKAEAFLSGGGELGERIRAFDWAATTLGAPAGWPQSLKTAIRIMLASRQPIWIGWGPDLTYFYNEPYKSIIGGKHPWALGRPTRDVWAEIWGDIGPLLDTALAGQEGTYSEEQLLIMERHGYQEETYYTFSYTSIPDDEGGVGGIICANTDDTHRVLAERQSALLKELAGSALQSAGALEACVLSAAALSTNHRDLPFAMIYLIDEERGGAQLAGTSGIGPDHGAARRIVTLSEDTLFAMGDALNTREMAVVDLPPGEWPAGPWPHPPTRVMVAPILPAAEGGRAAVLVAGLNPLRQLDANYRDFLGLVAAQLASNIARAEAFEEEKRRVAALAEIDRAKTIFFSNTSHEFRTPLTLMLGPLQDLLSHEDGAVVPAPRADLEMMQRNGARLLKLVNTLLDFSRIEAGKIDAVFEPVDLAAYTAELASTFRSAMARANLDFIVDCPPQPDEIYVDRDMWEKIVLNLVSNAFKYTLAGQVIVSLRTSSDGDHVELSVGDTGVGIPQDQLPLLFDRFHRIPGQDGRSQEGTGIGLALVQELVRLHGGVIGVESGPGGSTFRVSLPRGAAHLPQDRVRAAPVAPSAGGGTGVFAAEAMRWLEGNPSFLLDIDGEAPAPITRPACETGRPLVLLADDNADMRDYVRRLLSERYDVHVVSDGQAALDAARRRRPDLVLSDVMMSRMDGFGLTRALRADDALRDIPVILLSARAGEDSSVDGLTAGADDYLVKPFSARELLARVRANIDLSSLRREALRVENELRRKAEDAQERIESILSSIRDGLLVLDRDWRFVYLNPAAEQLLGSRAGDVIGKNHWDVYPDALGSPLETNYRRAMNERVTLSFENYYDPWRRWFDLRVFPTQEGGISIYFQDISERKAQEQALQATRTRLEAIYQASGDGLALCKAIWDGDGHVTEYQVLEVNRAHAELTGATRQQMLTQTVSTISPPIDPRWFQTAEKVLKTGIMHNFDIRSPATGRWLNIRVARVSDDLFQQTFVDISDRHRLEEQRQALMKEMSHRVMNNFQMVASFLHVQASTADPAAKTQMRTAERRLMVVAKLHSFLSYTESEGDVDAGAYVTELCDYLRSLIERPEAVNLTCVTDNIMLPAGKVTPVGFVISELIANSAKYAYPSPLKGTIHVSLKRNGDLCSLVVEDDGCGLGASQPAKGGGLGTRLVQSFVQQIGGELVTTTGPGVRHAITFPINGN
jgi:PAS domain S-box-containing protein